jgi:hypothetical protein
MIVLCHNYRFYLLNAHDHITDVHVTECESVDDIQGTALSLLAEHPAAAAIEAWEPNKLVYRSKRPKTTPLSPTAA